MHALAPTRSRGLAPLLCALFVTSCGALPVDDRDAEAEDGAPHAVDAVMSVVSGGPTASIATDRAPHATSEVHLALDLNLATANVDAFDESAPWDTSNYVVTARVYDEHGAEHTLIAFLSYVGAGDWSWVVMSDGANLDPGAAGVMSAGGQGILRCGSDGVLPTWSSTLETWWRFAGTSRQQRIVWSLAPPSRGESWPVSRCNTSPTSLLAFSQDGYPR
jgi:hypothetical protein